MTNRSFRNTMGLASLSALALVMVACGGSSSSSTPAAPVNQAPSAPVIVGPTNAITKHPAFYQLSSTDPEGSAVTFTVTGTGFTGSGNAATLNASAAGPAVLTVVAKDSANATSAASSLTVQVAANRPPQFISPNTGQLTGSSSSTISMPFQVSAQDPDTDDVKYTYTVVGYTNVTGGAVTINDTTGVGSFTGTVAAGQTQGSVQITVTAEDKLPGTSTMLGATATQTLTLTYFTGNLPPTITTTSIPAVPQNHGIPLNSSYPAFQFTGNDPLGVATSGLTWQLISPPAGFAWQTPLADPTMSSNGRLVWTSNFATGADFAPRTITVKLDDGLGLSDTKTFSIPVISDTKPNFVTQTYTETVGGVQFIDPARVRQTIDSRLKFNWLDVEATLAEFFSDANNTIKGWRAGVTATDAENDTVTYSVKPNSVFRFGVPYTATTAANYPGVDATTGEIKWTPNRRRFNNGPTAAGDQSLAGTLLHDYVANTSSTGDSLRNVLDPANWSFTIVAEQVINAVKTPGQFNETTLVIKVQPNDRPYQGPANEIWKTPTTLADLMHGVYYNGGSAVSGVGRPNIQEPQASDTNDIPHSDAPTSSWIWVVGTPGGANFGSTASRNDYGLFDPNTNALDGHMDAIKIDFGYRPETSDHLVNGPLTGLVAGVHYPTLDTTGNFPAINTSASLTNGFYNPWISGTAASPGNEVVSWSPVRIQYTLGRYIGQSAYKFGLVSEDQYGRMNKGDKSVFPIFGTVFMFNSRYIWLGDRYGVDASGPWDAAARGNYVPSGNTATQAVSSDQTYVFSYLPKGISNSGVGYAEWVNLNTTATYGANLFGRSDGAGAYASGVNTNTDFPPPAPGAGNYYNASAGAWMTLDGVNPGPWGPFYEPYAANPLNQQLNPASRAAANPGTGNWTSQQFVQFKGGAPDGTGGNPVQISVTAEGPYADNQVMARIVPSNSPYDFFINNGNMWTTAYALADESNDGYNYPRYLNTIKHGDDSTTSQPMRHFYGHVQSEVNYALTYPGREVYFSVGNEGSASLGDNASGVTGVGVGQLDTQAPRLRVSYTWPTIVTTTATGYPTALSANIFGERDVMQVATPHLSGNARFFFTGNYPAGFAFAGTPTPISIANGQERGLDGADPNWFGKFGFTGNLSAATDVTQRGFANSITAPFQPIQAVTDSIWIPNNADLHFNFPNAYTTPAGGSGYTDIPFIGTRGYLDRQLIPAINQNETLAPNWMDLNLGAHKHTWLQIGISSAYSINGKTLDQNANPALLATAYGDRMFTVWMKQDVAGTVPNAYGAWGGSQLIEGASVVAKGGITTAPGFWMSSSAGALTDTQAQISFAQLNGQLGAPNQALTGSTGIGADGWRRSEFELIGNIMGAPAQFGLSGRVRAVHPQIFAGDTSQITNFLWDASARLDDGIVRDSLVVYGVRDRGTKVAKNGSNYSTKLGEAGIEPGAPILAQWWNTNGEAAGGTPQVLAADINLSGFPNVIKAFADEWLPAAEFTQVTEIKHNFVTKVVAPGATAAGDVVQKVYLEQGVVAPKGHILLSSAGGIKPVVTPVRQLAINDLNLNLADGSLEIGTKLDIFNGNAVNATTGAPAVFAPDYRLYTGNGSTDWTLNGYSNQQITFQPAVNDQRHPSGYIVTIYRVSVVAGTPNRTVALPIAEYTMGHLGGIGALQTLNLPPFVSLNNTTPPANNTTAFYAVNVRNVWMEGTEGAAGHSLDMGKEPHANRFPKAWADCFSGVFVVRY